MPRVASLTSSPALQDFRPLARRDAAITTAMASPMASRVKGKDIIWACRSANRNVKKGNSVISWPGGSGGIMRLLCQKSNWPKRPPSKRTRQVLRPSWMAPSRFPRTVTNSAPVRPATMGDRLGPVSALVIVAAAIRSPRRVPLREVIDDGEGPGRG